MIPLAATLPPDHRTTEPPNHRTTQVLVIGGGLAGLATASALAPRGFKVTLLESRNRLGGRAGSFPFSPLSRSSGRWGGREGAVSDPPSPLSPLSQSRERGEPDLIDACQHVSMGCCTNYDHFCKTVGIDHFLASQPTLYFMTPDRRVSRFRADRLPAPLHLARAFANAHYLTASEKLRVAWGLFRLVRERPDADPPFRQWLLAHRQTERTIDRFWGLVLVSALNESVDRIGLRYARKVFRDGFLSHPRGFEVRVPTVPLGRLYGDELIDWFTRHGVETKLNEGVSRIVVSESRVQAVQLRSGETRTADVFVAAVPFDRLLDLLPPRTEPYFANLKRLEVSPITSVHLWWDRPIMQLPHAVLIDGLGQWVFNRGANYVQVVVSAAKSLRGLGNDEIQRRIVAELKPLFPDAKNATLIRSRVVTEQSATFSAVPGVDEWRPQQTSPIENLFIAGDWTATGWPATMEGAVRSGYLAAEAALQRAGRPERIVRPDLA